MNKKFRHTLFVSLFLFLLFFITFIGCKQVNFEQNGSINIDFANGKIDNILLCAHKLLGFCSYGVGQASSQENGKKNFRKNTAAAGAGGRVCRCLRGNEIFSP